MMQTILPKFADYPQHLHALVYFLRSTGQPVRRFYRSWKTAGAKAGIPGKRLFHDFRRTAVSNLTRAGVPEKIVMDISGYKTRAILTAITSKMRRISGRGWRKCRPMFEG